MSNLRALTARPEYLLAMKCLSFRGNRTGVRRRGRDRFLLRYLNIESLETALEVIEKYYPRSLFPQKTFTRGQNCFQNPRANLVWAQPFLALSDLAFTMLPTIAIDESSSAKGNGMTAAFDLAFIGAGNMAEGILAAVLDRQIQLPGQVIVSDPVAERRDYFVRRFGVTATDDNRRLVQDSRTIVLAIKPKNFPDLAASVASLVRTDHLFVSILAGMSTGKLEAALALVRCGP